MEEASVSDTTPVQPSSGRQKTGRVQGRRAPTVLLGVLISVVVLVIGGAVIGGPLVLTHRANLPLELFYGNGAVGLTARLGARSVPTPAPQGRAGRAQIDGSLAFSGSCSVCHGASGNGRGIMGQATYPPATDLTASDAKGKSDSELFWIIKNGLSFTGMPSFGAQYNDQAVWSIVAYIRTLQNPGQGSTVAGGGGGARPNPAGNAAERGAAVFVAQGCAACHSVGGTGGLSPLRGGGGESSQAVRQGVAGMPSYSAAQLSDAELADLNAYLTSASGGSGGGGGN
jgi:mono/diheme cytochrome c family protein